MPKLNYVAKLNGEVIGKRSSTHRVYTHAWIIQFNEERARDAAYNYQPTQTDRLNFEHYLEIVDQGVNHEHVRAKAWRPEPDLAFLKVCQDITDKGWAAYVADRRANAINWFEVHLLKGGFKPHVGGWAGSLALAQKASSSRGGVLVAIVAVERV